MMTSWPNVGAEKTTSPRLKQWCSKLPLYVPGHPNPGRLSLKGSRCPPSVARILSTIAPASAAS